MKKIIFSLMMICMMVLSSGVVFADVIPINLFTGEIIHYEEPSNFFDYLDSPLSEITILLLLFYLVIGFTLIIVKKMKKKKKLRKKVKRNQN